MSVVIRVGGMSCGHCADTIRQAVAPLAGVDRVDVDVATGIVTAHGDCDAASISAAITQAGYTPEGEVEPAPRPSLPMADASKGHCCCG